jgi:hypothetical protein
VESAVLSVVIFVVTRENSYTYILIELVCLSTTRQAAAEIVLRPIDLSDRRLYYGERKADYIDSRLIG